MAKFHVPNFHLSFENSGFGNLMEAGGILSLLQALTEPGVGERDTTRMDIRYERIMIRNNQNGNFAHSGRARRLSKGIKARTFQLFPVSFLCTAFGSFSLSSSHLSSDTLRGKLKPQTTTLRNSKWILSARPTPPSTQNKNKNAFLYYLFTNLTVLVPLTWEHAYLLLPYQNRKSRNEPI